MLQDGEAREEHEARPAKRGAEAAVGQAARDASGDNRALGLDMRRRLIPATRPTEADCDMHDDTCNDQRREKYAFE